MTFEEFIDDLDRSMDAGPKQVIYDESGWPIHKFKPFFENSPLASYYDPCYPIGEIYQEMVYYRPEWAAREYIPHYETLDDGTRVYGHSKEAINYVHKIPACFGTNQDSIVLPTIEEHNKFITAMSQFYHMPPAPGSVEAEKATQPTEAELASFANFKKEAEHRIAEQLDQILSQRITEPLTLSMFAPGPMPGRVPTQEGFKVRPMKSKKETKSVVEAPAAHVRETRTPIPYAELMNIANQHASRKPDDTPRGGEVTIETAVVDKTGAPTTVKIEPYTSDPKLFEEMDVGITVEYESEAASDTLHYEEVMPTMIPIDMGYYSPMPMPTSMPGCAPTNMWGQPIQQYVSAPMPMPQPVWNYQPMPMWQPQPMMVPMVNNDPLPRFDEQGNPIKYREGNPPILGRGKLEIPDYMKSKLPPYEIPADHVSQGRTPTPDDPFGTFATKTDSPIPTPKPGETITDLHVSNNVIKSMEDQGIKLNVASEGYNEPDPYRPGEFKPMNYTMPVDAWGRPIPQYGSYGYMGMNPQPLPMNPYAIPQPSANYRPKVDYYNPYPEFYNRPYTPLYRPFNGNRFSPYVSMAQQREYRDKYIEMQKVRYRTACIGAGIKVTDEEIDALFNPQQHKIEKTPEQIAEEQNWREVQRYMYYANNPIPYVVTPEESTAIYMQTYSRNFHNAFDNHSLCEFLEEDLPRLMREFWIAENIKKNSDRDMRGIYNSSDYNSILEMHARSNPYIQKCMEMAALQDPTRPKKKSKPESEEAQPSIQIPRPTPVAQQASSDDRSDLSLGMELVELLHNYADPNRPNSLPQHVIPEEIKKRQHMFNQLINMQAQEKAEMLFHNGKLITQEDADKLGPEDEVVAIEYKSNTPRINEAARAASEEVLRNCGGTVLED